MFASKKGQAGVNLGALWGILVLGAVVVVSGIFLAYGTDIVSDVQSDFVTNVVGCNSTSVAGCGSAYNVTADSITAIGNLADKQDTVTNIGIAAIVLGLLLSVAAGVMVFKNYM